MTKKLKKRLRRIIAGTVCFGLCIAAEKLIPNLNANILLIAYLLTYFIVGNDVVKGAAAKICCGQMFDEEFLMVIATVGAFLISEYPEAVAVMLFYQVGEWFQSYAVNKSRKSIKELMDIRPDYANVCRDGAVVTVDPQEVARGEMIQIKPGERIPLDGVIITGNTSVDTMALTGESLPRDLGIGDEVISGCINLSGLIEVRVSKEFGESTVSKILDLVENSASKKAETENFITKFARYYTPIVVVLATILAVIPSIVTGDWAVWVYRALSFLVISCPCALVISVPLSFFGGIGAASKAGILVKGSNYLEALAEARVAIMDKTGTLTKGEFAVSEIKTVDADEKQALFYAAYAERFSNHPIAKCLVRAYEERYGTLTNVSENPANEKESAVEEMAGYGVLVMYEGKTVAVGNEKLMERQLKNNRWNEIKNNVLHMEQEEPAGTICHVSYGDSYVGYILIEDQLKPDAVQCIAGLKKEGVRRIVMLTGDREKAAEKIAGVLGIREYHASLLPGDKVDRVEEIFAEKKEDGKLIFVGDGMNDAPVLARADIGIAMGGLGSDAAIEAADIVIMTDEPGKIPQAMRISKKTLQIVKQNIIFAIGVKVLVLLLAAFGIATMWAAVFADVGVAFIAILNAMRALKLK
ncbi:MAG: heavy metal translocating P-type ATPase [Lachnospiraceae bacterium]|nr:heavy metal translocating P-type ATPase [Lachnospiraceae bacterium]